MLKEAVKNPLQALSGRVLKRAAVGLVPGVVVAAVLGASYFAAPTPFHGTLVACSYGSPAPVVTNVTPAAGPIRGGTHVTITGTGFCNGTDVVFFGGRAATGLVFVSDTKLTATSPANAAGVVDVRVTNTGGTSAIAGGDKFRYVSATWCALIDMSRAPTSWTKGVAQKFYVYVFNCGRNTWPATGYTRVDINVHFTTKLGSGFNTQQYWKTMSYKDLVRNVAPNSSYAFTITLNPTFTGSVWLEAEMIKKHQLWFGRYVYRPAQFVYVAATVS